MELTTPTARDPVKPTDDVLIKIEYAGTCHSDIHTVNGDWGQLPDLT
jgi:alcohol dehydrogenase (NADP+)